MKKKIHLDLLHPKYKHIPQNDYWVGFVNKLHLIRNWNITSIFDFVEETWMEQFKQIGKVAINKLLSTLRQIQSYMKEPRM
jgi:hypothetical protein